MWCPEEVIQVGPVDYFASEFEPGHQECGPTFSNSNLWSLCTQDTWNSVLWIWCIVLNARSLDTNRLAAGWMSSTWSVVERLIVMPSSKDRVRYELDYIDLNRLSIFFVGEHSSQNASWRGVVIPGDSEEVFLLQLKSGMLHVLMDQQNVSTKNEPHISLWHSWPEGLLGMLVRFLAVLICMVGLSFWCTENCDIWQPFEWRGSR